MTISSLTIFQEGLKRYGFNVKGYFSHPTALEEFHPRLYDVDKVNVMMHAMNDKDLYKHLASVDKAIKILLLTCTIMNDNEINKMASIHLRLSENQYHKKSV